MNIRTIEGQNIGPCTAAIGYFDGVHPGHRAVVEAAVDRAREQGLVCAAVTFSFEGFRPRGKGSLDLMQRELCFEELQRLGVDVVVQLPMVTTASLSPHEFCRLLKERLLVESVFCGDDFRFGKGREGDIETLKKEGEELGFSVQTHDEVLLGGEPISTTRIKEHLAAGEPGKAAELLGRPVAFWMSVIEEKKLARTFGYPTANGRFPDIMQPKAGSYITRTTLSDGRQFISVTNLGVRPTVGGRFFCSETHILDFSEELVGSEITVELLEFLREEQHFEDLESLKNAIAADAAAAALYKKQNP